MADESSDKPCVKKEADFKRILPNNSKEITNITNGDHQVMERERVKKKPGKAVIISGTSTEPPIHDKPIDVSDTSEYVMEYTDIFGSNSASGVVDSEGEVEESSDTEIVGHSKENAHYTKSGDDEEEEEEDEREEPPPLESEDDYEYDDSDLGLSPPPMGSDGSDLDGYVLSSTYTSPAKSLSSVSDNIKGEKEPLFKPKVDRRDSKESDLGYREGPPPLDSEEEPEEEGLMQNGVNHSDLEENYEEKGEGSENEPDIQRDIGSRGNRDTDSGENRDTDSGENRDTDSETERDIQRDIDRDTQPAINHEVNSEINHEIDRPIQRDIDREIDREIEGVMQPESEEELDPDETVEELQENGPEDELDENDEVLVTPETTEGADEHENVERQETFLPFEDEELDLHQEKRVESPVSSISPEPSQIPEGDGYTDSETSEPNQPMMRQETPDIMSDPEAPLLNDDPEPTFVPVIQQLKKNKVSLKEKGNTREKSSLLKSESSEDDGMEPSSGTYGGQTHLSESESESESVTEEVKAAENIKLIESETVGTKYSKDGNVNYKKQINKDNTGMKAAKSPRDTTSNKNTGSKKVNSVDAKKKVPTKQTNDSKANRPKVSAQGRGSSRGSSVENSTEDLTKKASKIAGSIGTERHVRVKQASGMAVKDERPRTKKINQEVRKHAPGLPVKETTSTIRQATGRSKENLNLKEEKKKTRSPVDSGETLAKKTRSEAQDRSRKANVPVKKEERSKENVNATKNETRSKNTRNGDIVKTRPRPKISTKNYVAIGTEDDDEPLEETNELFVDENKTSKTKTLETREISQENAKPKQKPRERSSVKTLKTNEQPVGKGHTKHDRSKHVWLCRDDEIHKLIAQKASLLKEYESGSLAGKHVFSGQKGRHGKEEEPGLDMPEVGFSGNKSKSRSTRPMSEIIGDREPYTSRKRENRRSLQHRYSGSSSEDDDERTNKAAAAKRDKGPSGTFSVGMSSRNFATQKHEDQSDSEHEETCEYCAAEKAAKKAQERDLAWEGPHHPRNLLLGVVYTAKYLGSSQIMSAQSPNRSVRMQQAQEAVGRIKVPEGEDQPTTDVDLFISTERIKVVNSINKEIMMDHALRTVSFIADIGDVLVLMARRPPGDNENILETKPSSTQILASVAKAETDPKMIKITCHVFQAPEAQIIAKSIGQAFNVAYQEFLRTNGISEESVEDAEYNCVLEAQKILGEDLSLLSDASKSREVVVNKKPAESLGIMIVESGWGSMIPTAIIAHLAKEGPAAKSGRLNVGDQILAVNNTSLVGLPLVECQTIIKNSRPGTKVVMKVVSCPPTVQVVVNRPDTKYQLGFSVQNGMICSLMRGSIAERGGVRVGHRIIEINGQSVVATSHQHIVDLLASTTGEIRMKTMPASMYRLLVGLDVPQYI
ncbi:uncharacterized protein LOC116306634 isoform X2 [Actinia tenebrosa]|uniref:Uncharacterized protein LOC116306634 isoform X2 n=1 Tax=Actinia tenebrosa TaxID=6105 RepID=A0A6P8IZF3_ACTTE|nr:uncharacterized protein LOC116306634 isoform X2 [Actinia tenebrosa]